MENIKADEVVTNCEVDAETKESLLKHLDEHGAVSFLTSAKFGRYTGCVLEEIEGVIAAESALIAPAAVDSTETQDAPPTPADEATESPAAMRAHFQSRQIATSYRQGRI